VNGEPRKWERIILAPEPAAGPSRALIINPATGLRDRPIVEPHKRPVAV